MDKQLTIRVPDASGEEGLTQACKRGELFRHDAALERWFRQGYHVHDYEVEDVERTSTANRLFTRVKVLLRKYA